MRPCRCFHLGQPRVNLTEIKAFFTNNFKSFTQNLEFEKRLREMRDHPNLIDGLLQKWQKIKIEESENKKTKYQLPTIRKIPYLALSFSVMATLGILGKV